MAACAEELGVPLETVERIMDETFGAIREQLADA